MASVLVNGTTIEYDAFGSEANDPIVLISGLGVQMIRWSLPFCNILAARGFRVIRFDNRDVGLSTYFDNAPVPDLTTVAKAVASGENPEVPYTLDNMASDVIGLFDALGIEQAHLVGRSMGGMIAQLVASSHPDRVLSLAVIMSGTGNAALPPSAPDAMAALMRPAPHPLDDEAGFLNHAVATARVIANPAYPFDEDAQRAQALTEIKRAYNPAGFGRQLAALVATGDIRPRLHGITAATVVMHGSADKLVPPEAGRDIAANIKDAELMIMEGMGHDLPPELYNVVVTAIVENARR